MSDHSSPLASDSEKNSEKSDNFEELSAPDSNGSNNGSVSYDAKNSAEIDFDKNLPETVSLLRGPNESKVYLVGTAHFSKKSQDEVAMVIRAVRPHFVVIELCASRTNIFELDEKTLLEEAKNMNMEKIMSTIKQNGVFNGLMYILLLNMSVRITEQLGMAPGGEFRTAFLEAHKLGCVIHLGDRPIDITLHRAIKRLSWFQTLKLGWHLLTTKDPISKEDVEKCKQRDILEELLAEMAGEFPALGEVFVHERDIYLTYSLQRAGLQTPLVPDQTAGRRGITRVVGVVGMGHVPGITKLWPTVQEPYIAEIMKVPPPSVTSRILRLSFKLSLLSFGGYLLYRYLPVPKSVKNITQGYVQNIVDRFNS